MSGKRFLGDKLFTLVEADQGKAFVSDGINVLSDKEILHLAEQSVAIYKRLIPKMEKWIAREKQRMGTP